MRRVLIVAAVLSLAAGCGGPASAPTVSGTPASGGLGAAAPTSSAAPTKSATPTTKPRPKWSEAVEPCPYEGQKVVIREVQSDDVTQDGAEDHIVTRGCEASTAYWPSTIEVFDGEAGPAHPKRIGTLLKGNKDLPWVTEVAVAEGVITVKAYGRTDLSPSGCPDLKLTYRFQHTGKTFQQIGRDATKAGDCLPVG
ncbi:hypothetical protein [Paractinoplanes atraurantiacus]|uniref:DUF3558 domain-containing protein n=1 Tax=Paractinoplanes atraurantiacus TaxID=1036182 RepID=A0A285KIH5_9ACTN|nr:hypothetical protein [Actinoplanes atraurantiacus]SNY71236.1 hypothetical protein SAMN05421748_13967 [Actinoplanes atraurantiacus]